MPTLVNLYNAAKMPTVMSQPAALFHLFTDEQKQRLFANIAEDIRDVPEQIQRRQIGLFLKVDPAYGKGVADALGLKLD